MKPPLISFYDVIAYRSPWRGLSNDSIYVWVFGGESALSADQVDQQLQSRAQFLTQIRRRMRNLPGKVDYPYWVADPSPISDHLHHDAEPGRSWVACQDAIATIRERQYLDPRQSVWELHVFYEVADVPGCRGPATVIAWHVCHALISGAALPEISQALFGDEPREMALPGAPEVVSGRLPWWAVGRLMAAAPAKAVAQGLRALSQRKAIGWHDLSEVPLSPATSINKSVTRDRVMRSLRFDLAEVKREGYSVTVVGLVAVSRALELCFLNRGEQTERLSCLVPVGVTDDGTLGVNQFLAARVGLRVDVVELRKRADLISAALRGERARLQSPELLKLRHEVARTSWPAYLLIQAVTEPFFKYDLERPVVWNTVLSSMNAGHGPYSLCGQPVVACLSGGFIGGWMNLGHTLMGIGNSVSITIQAAADIGDIDGYATLLHQAFVEVGEALASGLDGGLS